MQAGGIFLCRKIAMLAEAYQVPCVLHGAMGLRLAGFLQASAAIGAEWQELVFIRPPLLPEEVWSPGLQVLNTKTMYTFRDGEIEVPDLPGLGLDVNEEAVRKSTAWRDFKRLGVSSRLGVLMVFVSRALTNKTRRL